MTDLIKFKLNLAPGDTLVATSAIRDLHLAYPDKFKTTFVGTAGYLFDNNPYISQMSLREERYAEDIQLRYPLINSSNKNSYHFIHGFRKHLEKELNLIIPPTEMRGDVHISDKEKYNPLIEGDYWVIFAGGKYDFTAKWWNPHYYQSVIDHFKGTIKFVQAGLEKHFHPKLNGVVDMIGKCEDRKIINLIYHSVGVVTPVSFGMHLASAVPSSKMVNRACVVIAGGREPVQWEMYPWHKFLHSVGTMDCCAKGGCWKSRCQQVGDGDKKDNPERMCEYPVELSNNISCEYNPLSIPKCMYDIKPQDVIHAIESWYNGGVLEYGV